MTKKTIVKVENVVDFIEKTVLPAPVVEAVDYLPALLAAGFKVGTSPDDTLTKTSIKLFQKFNQLPITCEFDEQTVKALNEYL